jgi:hypothetical protein
MSHHAPRAKLGEGVLALRDPAETHIAPRPRMNARIRLPPDVKSSGGPSGEQTSSSDEENPRAKVQKTAPRTLPSAWRDPQAGSLCSVYIDGQDADDATMVATGRTYQVGPAPRVDQA